MTSDHHTSTSSDSQPDTPSYEIQPDWEDYPNPSDAIIDAVAAVTNRSPLELPPLYGFIDPEALDGLVSAGVSGIIEDITVSFHYDGLEVTVSDTIVIQGADKLAASD